MPRPTFDQVLAVIAGCMQIAEDHLVDEIMVTPPQQMAIADALATRYHHIIEYDARSISLGQYRRLHRLTAYDLREKPPATIPCVLLGSEYRVDQLRQQWRTCQSVLDDQTREILRLTLQGQGSREIVRILGQDLSMEDVIEIRDRAAQALSDIPLTHELGQALGFCRIADLAPVVAE